MLTLHNVLLASSIGLIGLGVMSPVAASASRAMSESESLRLVASSYNAGKVGKALLVPEGNSTAVHVELSGVPNYTTRPIHLYTYIHDGTCSSRNSTARYALNRRVLAQSMINPGMFGAFSGPVQLNENIPVALSTIRARKYALVVRASPADGGHEIFCGDNSH